jgi:Spy/CpxP family protein refolding chaperone
MTRTSRIPRWVVVLSAALLVTAVAPAAQRGGGGGGMRGGGMAVSNPTRLTLLVSTFKLDDDQKKQVKKIMDDAYKAAKPLREQLKDAREALGDAVQEGGGSLASDALVTAYAKEAAAMADAEMKALAQILAAIQFDAAANPTAEQSAVSIMLGAFVGTKWDMSPDMTLY